MAITTYSELQAAVASWLHRRDLTTRIPDFIALAESKLNRRLRLRAQEETATLTGTINSAVVSLPSAFVEPLGLWILDDQGNRDELRYEDPDDFLDSYGTGEPERWTIDGLYVRLNIKCDSAYSFTFRYRKGFALSDAVPTNWLLTNHPDVYLYATLAEASPFTRDEGGLIVAQQLLEAAIAEVNLKEGRSRSHAVLTVDNGMASGCSQSILTGD